MKKTVALAMIVAALALTMSARVVMSETKMSDQIPWVSSFDEALKRAKQQDKPILLDFYNPK